MRFVCTCGDVIDTLSLITNQDNTALNASLGKRFPFRKKNAIAKTFKKFCKCEIRSYTDGNYVSPPSRIENPVSWSKVESRSQLYQIRNQQSGKQRAVILLSPPSFRRLLCIRRYERHRRKDTCN